MRFIYAKGKERGAETDGRINRHNEHHYQKGFGKLLFKNNSLPLLVSESKK